MVVETTGAFLDVLQKSNLLTREQLATAKEMAAQTADAKALARSLVRQNILTAWQAGQLVLVGRTSFFIGKYKLMDLLGRGGMGKVYLAEHVMMNRPAALKLISEQLGKDSAALERFLNEARAVAALDHPNIVHAFNVDSEGDRYYMVLEYVEGQDLRRIVETEGPLEFARAADYIRQAADGLAHAHSKGMIHCDIKPSNLLVNAQGVVKILDMGMARIIDKKTSEQEQQNGSGGLVGTIDYMAPEQAARGPNFDHRADIYSLGCTLYFLLSGHAPFAEGTIAERIVKHQAQEPRSLLEERPDTPADLAKICEKMMAKDPANRFQTAADLSGVLSQWRPPATKILRAVPLDESEDKEETGNQPSAGSDAGDAAKPEEKGEKMAAGRSLPSVPGRVLRYFREDRRRTIAACAGGGAIAIAILGVILVAALRGRSGHEAKVEPPRVEEPVPAKTVDPATRIWGDLKMGIDQKPDPKTESPKEPPKKEAPKPKAKPDPSKTPAKPEPAKPASPKLEPPKAQLKEPPKESPKEPPKPEPPKPAPPTPGGDPLRDLPKFVDLPVLEEGQKSTPVPLGQIHSPPETPWDVNLVGGDAIKANRQFTLQRKDEGGKPAWLAVLTATVRGAATQVEIARLWRDKDSLMFQWLDTAPPAHANYLRNCVLEVRASGPIRPMPFRAPQQVDPLPIDFHRGTTQTVEVDFLPDAKNLRVEITSIEKTRGERIKPEAYAIEPRPPIVPGPPVTLGLLRKDIYQKDDIGLSFQLTAKAKASGLSLDLRLPKKYIAMFKGFRSDTIRLTAVNPLRELEQRLKDPKNQNDQKLKLQKDQLDFRVWMADMYDALNKVGKVHFRLYFEAGNQQVELARSEAPPKDKK